MPASHGGNEYLEAAPASLQSDESTTELPEFHPAEAPEDDESTEVTPPDDPQGHGRVFRPLSESLLADDSELVVEEDEPEDCSPVALQQLGPLLGREEPLTWIIAGARLTGDLAFGDGRLVGEWFAEEWRAESGRATDLVIDASWPGCTLAQLKSHLKTRVVRHRPDVAVLLFDRSDASGGVEELVHFERRLVAVLSVLTEIGAVPVLAQTPLDPAGSEIDSEIFFEAISGIARERGLPHLVLPREAASPARLKTPDSQARNCALFLCREAMRAI